MTVPDLGRNLACMFEARASEAGERPLLWAKSEGRFAPWSWARVRREARAFAATLGRLGIGPDDKVAIVADNRPEWCVADLAILYAAGITVPSYTTYTSEDYAWLLEHCEARVLVMAGGPIAKRLLPALAGAPQVRALIALDPIESDGLGVEVVRYEDAVAAEDGGAEPPGLAREADAVACFIYTSGTGGRPKGVMLTHANIMANVKGTWRLFEHYAQNERAFLSFLPLSHSYEHTVGQFLPIAINGQIYYADGVEHLLSNLAEVRPQLLPCVPRLFEVFRQRLIQAIERQGGLKARLFWKTVELGTRRYHTDGRLPLHLHLLDKVLDRLVRHKVGERFGGRLTAMVCGGGPLNPEIGIFFAALGVPVCHGYGQTETSPVVSVTPPGARKLHTVGPPLDGVEVEIAPDGEILVRGDLVMKGYWKDAAATDQAVVDGWLQTGDVGRLDDDGYIQITDRKKDLIVLSGGDNVAPQRIEALLAMEPEIGQVLVHGDKRAFLIALIAPSAELQKEVARASDDAQPDRTKAIERRIDAAVKRANAKLGAVERVRRFAVLEDGFSVENGLMTPTMKLRRPLIYAREAATIERLHGVAKVAA